jgi:mannosyltransferase
MQVERSAFRRISVLTRAPILVTAIAVVAAVLRGARLTGNKGLTGDEGFTLALAQRPFGHLLHLFTYEANGIVYPLLEWPIVRINESLLALRLPAFLAGVLAVVALYWVAQRMVGRREALVASSLLALNPLAIGFSQMARPYMLAMLFGIVSFGCLDRVETDRRYWFGYVTSLVLVGYSNAFAAPLLIAAQAVFVLERRRLLRKWLYSVAVTALALIPLLALLLAEHSKRNALYWLDKPTLWTAEHTAADLVAGRKSLLLIAIVVAAALVTGGARDRRMLSVAAWAVLPPLLLFALAQVSPVFLTDYLLVALPGALLLFASAALKLPRALGPLAIAAVAVLFVLGGFIDLYHAQGWQPAARALQEQRANDPVIFDIPDGLTAAGFYDRQFAAPDGNLIVNEWSDEPLPRNVTLLDDPGGYGHAPDGPPSAGLISHLAHRTGVVYLMVYETARQADVLKSPGLQWAQRACRSSVRKYGVVRMVKIESCS